MTETKLPQGYKDRPWDYDGPLFTVGQMKRHAARSVADYHQSLGKLFDAAHRAVELLDSISDDPVVERAALELSHLVMAVSSVTDPVPTPLDGHGAVPQEAPSDAEIIALSRQMLADKRTDNMIGFARTLLARYGAQPAVNFGLQEAPSDEVAAMEVVMEKVDPATWPGLTAGQRCALGRFAKPQPSGNVGALDDVLADALSNLEHDNYERSYSGSQNREADAALIRAALVAQPQPSGSAGDTLAAFDAAVATVLPRISTLKYNSQEICKHFAGEVRAALAAPQPAKPSRGEAVARVSDDGFIVETGLGLAPGTLLYTSPQPAGSSRGEPEVLPGEIGR